MKKYKKIIISVLAILCALGVGIFVFYKYFYDANKLSLTEKDWINNHKTSVISFNIPNDLNIFATSGKGVYYDFLKGLEEEYDINLNRNISAKYTQNGLGFTINKNKSTDGLLMFKDHYVLVAKDYYNIKDISDINGSVLGGLTSDISRLGANYKISATINASDNINSAFENLKSDSIKYLLVPLNEYIDQILVNNYKIVYHLDDLTNDYYIMMGSDKELNSIVTKYYNKWINKSFNDSYYSNTYELFVNKLNITEIELDSLTNKNYVYGFVNITPYQILSGSRFGGEILTYLEEFSKVSDVDFAYTKFKNNNDLVKAFNKGKVDLILDNSIYQAEKSEIKTNLNDKYYIISPLSTDLKVSSLNDLDNVEIYVIKDSKLAKTLSDYNNIKLKVLNNEKDLIKKTKENKIIAINADSYDYLINYKIKKYQISYVGYNANYNFKYQNNTDSFYKLFSNYINYISNNNISNMGLLSYQKAETNGKFISTIAKYILLVISVIVVIVGILIASKKQIKLNTKIRKDEKLRYIDMLTALKNRNYLTDRIEVWNQNTIYPQAIIVIDLNNIKYLNDTFGSSEGDKQIKGAANILHQTQLDNTEIMRTDGNEFMVYLVGYNEKQVVNYIKKLVKEFNELPYEYGAAFGFSMIVDDLKLIDDAINEATIQMRENKEIENGKHESEN